MCRHTKKTHGRGLIAGAIAAATLTTSLPVARAWYFPEHAELTRLGLVQYAPHTAVEAIQAAVDDARVCVPDPDAKDGCRVFTGLPICRDVGLPFSGTTLADSAEGRLSRPDLGAITTAYATCIPYGALPALAGDHALSAEDLGQLLTVPVGRSIMKPLTVAGMVTGSSVMAWRDFLEQAPVEFTRAFEATAPSGPGSPILGATMNRRKLTRDLDARLLLVDHDYLSRAAGSKAHFQNAARSMSEIVEELKTVGNTDNALAQMIAHHLHAMVLAIRAREPGLGRDAQRLLRAHALIEHAFALHFMQDAFSSGHVATEHALNNSDDRLQRHDHLCRRGLAARRVLARRSCPAIGPEAEMQPGELPYCWTAYGDGYLDIDNIPYVAEATARVQAQFALALEGEAWWRERLFGAPRADASCAGPRKATSSRDVIRFPDEARWEQATKESARLARLLDPMPTWAYAAPMRTAGNDDKRLRGDGHRHSLSTHLTIVERAFGALKQLQDNIRELDAKRQLDPLPSIACGSGDGAQATAARLARELVGEPFRPCAVGAAPDKGLCEAPKEEDDPACDAGDHLRVGYDVRLLRPLLVAWPGPQADPRTLEGRDSFGRGIAFQIGYGANGTWVVGSNNAGVFGVGATLGFALRADSLLPGRDNRAIVELNGGIVPSLIVGLPSHSARSTTYATIAFGELRAPILPLATLLLGYATRSANAVDPVRVPAGIGLYGVRAYVLVPSTAGGTGSFQFLGWDLDVAYVSLARDAIGRSASAGVAVTPELRLRVGSSPIVDVISAAVCGGGAASCGPRSGRQFGLGLELAGGFSWFL